jgi:hypothetical protein
LEKRYVAPKELGLNFGAGGYRHGAPTELFEMVHGPEKEEKK